jgi:hypothetical protein
MELTIHERILLLQLIPDNAEYALLKKIEEAKKQLDFSKAEVEKYQIVQQGQQVTYKVNEDTFDITMPEEVVAITIEKLKALDESKNLHKSQLSLYEKFIMPQHNIQ